MRPIQNKKDLKESSSEGCIRNLRNTAPTFNKYFRFIFCLLQIHKELDDKKKDK